MELDDESRSIKVKSGLRGNSRGKPSEIPCRVSDIARGGSDPVHSTGSNRWSPTGVAGAAGNTEGKIMTDHDPRNDSGLRPLDGATRLHKTPALTSIVKRHSQIASVR